MSPGSILIILSVLLVFVALAFAWQERRSSTEAVTIYSVEDSIRYVTERLSPAAAGRLTTTDVRRILEWEVRYLQDPAVHGTEPVVAGGLPAARYAQETLARLGYGYDGPDIIEVLDLRAAYLEHIGAVGEPLSAEEVAGLDLPGAEA